MSLTSISEKLENNRILPQNMSPDPSRSTMCAEQLPDEDQQQHVQTSLSSGSDEEQKSLQSDLDIEEQQQQEKELLQKQQQQQQQQQRQQEEELLQQQQKQQQEEQRHQQKKNEQEELLQQQQQQQQQEELLQQQKQEIEHLQQQLREQQEAMTRLQAHAHAQQIQANLLTTSLRTKLRRKEQDLKSAKSQHESCISAVISHLLYLEGQMQKEHNQVVGVLKEKDDVIRRQKAALEDITDKNDQLVMALKESNGYDVMDNGLSRPPLPVVTQNGKYPIQDHGNKVVLRGHKVTNGGHKVRFSSMKERLRRHKSSLELYHTEPLEPLVEGTLRYFGSQENLVDGDTGYLETGTRSAYINARKQRCRSLIVGPSDLQEADEIHNESPDSCFGEESLSSENISQSDSYSMGPSPPTSYSYYYGKRSESVPSNIGMNELAKSRSVPQALPTVSEKDGVGIRSWQSRERPHSLPSAGLLVGPSGSGPVTGSTKVSMSPSMSIPTTAANHLPPSSLSSSSSSSSTSSSSQPAPTTTSSSSTSSSLTESIKNVFKRRGSKKKRSVSLGQAANQQYQNSIKQHFKKYDMT